MNNGWNKWAHKAKTAPFSDTMSTRQLKQIWRKNEYFMFSWREKKNIHLGLVKLQTQPSDSTQKFFFSFSELFRSLIPLTSAWPPAVRSLLQRSHLRHSLCQSFPSDDTFSAANQRQKTEGSGINANIHIKKHLCRLLWIIPPSPSAPLSIVHVCITERPSISYCREEWRPPLLHYLQ